MMTCFDWMIVAIPILFIGWIAYKTQKFSNGVSGFMAGNRCADRYVLANARGESGMAVIGIVAGFEAFHQAGFTMGFWDFLKIPVAMFIALNGFVIYRYRETSDTKLFLLALLPFGEAIGEHRCKVKEINANLADWTRKLQINRVDFGENFLLKDGSISIDLMPDLLHSSEKGYQIFAESLELAFKQIK